MQNIESFFLKIPNLLGSAQSIVIHTILIALSFFTILMGVDLSSILLVLTTILSIEAIYLSLFIQLSVNKGNMDLTKVTSDTHEIKEDIEEIQKEVDDVSDDIEEIAEDIEEIQNNQD